MKRARTNFKYFIQTKLIKNDAVAQTLY